MNKKRLFAAFTACISFQTCYMRFCFLDMERAGLLEYENLIFILYCAAIVCGMLLAPRLMDWTPVAASPARQTVCVRAGVAAAAACAAGGYFTGGCAALAFQFLTVLFYAGAMAAVLRAASGSLAPRFAGRLYGFSGAVMHLVITALFYQPFAALSSGVILGLLLAILAAAGFFFTAQGNAQGTGPAAGETNAMPFANYAPLHPRVVRLALAVLVLFVVYGGLMDNLFYFDSVFSGIPNFHFYIFTYNILIYISAGFLFERIDPGWTAIGALALVGASQSLTLFSVYDFLAYPYALFSNAGYITMEVYLFMLPVAYCALTGRKPGMLPGLGFIMLYASFCLTAILFAFIPPTFYQPVQGVMLLVAIAAILVTVYMMSENRNHRFTLLSDELKKLRTANPAPRAGRELIEPLTGREREVLQYMLSGMSNPEISIALNISLSTVKTHVRNIYGKYDVRGRMELHRVFYQAKDL